MYIKFLKDELKVGMAKNVRSLIKFHSFQLLQIRMGGESGQDGSSEESREKDEEWKECGYDPKAQAVHCGRQ